MPVCPRFFPVSREAAGFQIGRLVFIFLRFRCSFFYTLKCSVTWVWIVLDVATKQVLAFYVEDRSASSARELWRCIPQVYRDHANFYTDGLAAYKTVLPAKKHQVCAKRSEHTNIIERFNCTLRQRVSRLVRFSLSFQRPSRIILERSDTSFALIITKRFLDLPSQPYICSTAEGFRKSV